MPVRASLATFLAAAALAAAGLPMPSAAQVHAEESVLRVPVQSADGRAHAIEVTLFRAPWPGPSPVVVLSHGSPRYAADRRRSGRMRFPSESRVFLSLGYSVAVPTRRGYGDSEGDWAEGYGTCADPDYFRAGLETARDIRATVEALRRHPGLEAKRFVLVGQSAGGWGSVAASSQPIEGLEAVVNFAGGRGSFAPHRVCREERLVEAAARFGSAARVPQLWIYSENDLYFGPDLARRMHSAFAAAGGKAELLKAPAVGTDGHAYFSHIHEWGVPVAKFLRRVAAEAPAQRTSTGS
jgi:dienelactone hydrolase